MGYPIQLVGLKGQRVLLAGGGAVAAEKAVPLIHAGARVHLVAIEVGPEIEELLPDVWRFDQRPVDEGDVEGARVVVAATDDSSVNRALVDTARSQGILAQAADDKPYCDFYSPAVIRRGPVMMTISTDGGSPLLAGQLRRLLEAAIPRSLTAVADLMVRLRSRGLKGLQKRGQLLRALFDPTITRLVDSGDTSAASERIEVLFNEEEELFEPGSVAIVGAGPGSRQLLTLRALDRIQRADLILHDALVEPEVLELALPGTQVVDVGHRASPHASGAEGVRRIPLRIPLMIEGAMAGKRVVRLHGGDPFVFGRGGEEVDALIEAGVTWEVVPGVSSILAAPAAAGTPLTQRDLARGFTVRTGHDTAGPTKGVLDPQEETVVVLMGLKSAPKVLQGLIKEGRSPDTPAIAVAKASREDEEVVVGNLSTLDKEIHAAGLRGPATLIVGEVARRALERIESLEENSTAAAIRVVAGIS
ncbi:MAG: uroporphyrinogen-III C-methyltransferase [Gemmatimonadota bacterium]|nr:uroporphyrinogen-III C-methyltransferase [Gemmatimonadota bacterium]